MTAAVSFAQLMDEDLARKLQNEEEYGLQEADIMNLIANQEKNDSDNEWTFVSDEEDYQVAESELQAHVEHEPEGFTLTDEELARKLAEEEDHLSALQLQEDMQSERYAYDLQQQYKSHNPNSKVGMAFDYENVKPHYTNQEDECDEEEELPSHPAKFAHGVNQSRKSRAAPLVTKHDKEANMRYNAANIEKFVDTGLPDRSANSRLPTSVYNSLKAQSAKIDKTRIRYNDKEDTASYEQALDPRTRLYLFKMLNTGILQELNGIVSTGKEANVYHAVGKELAADLSDKTRRARKSLPGGEYAIKIFKTTLNEFKNREEYMLGEWRFRHEASLNNPRRIIKLWAQKELRNLKRMKKSGILCPTPLLLKEHVLIMTFIGEGSRPAPRLQEAEFSSRTQEVYMEVVKNMRRLYQDAGLIHADLSPYNLLYFNNQVYFIDVSQAVENDHPHAMDFLRRDCDNMSKFFRSRGVSAAMSTRQLFEFVVDPSITADNIDLFLKTIHERNQLIPVVEDDTDANVFFNSFIPRTLSDVRNPLNEAFYPSKDFYHVVSGMKSDGSGVALVPEILEEDPHTSTEDEE